MPIDVQCTGCSKKLRAPDTAAGKKIKCPKCAAIIAVPAANNDAGGIQSVPPPPEPVTEMAKATPAPSRQREEEEDDDRPARRRRPDRDEDEDEDEDRPRRRQRDIRANEPSGTFPLVLGIISIVVSVLAIPLAFMGCCPPIAFIAAGLAGLGLLLGGGGTLMAFIQKRGLPCPIIGTTISVIALGIVVAWGVVWGGFVMDASKKADEAKKRAAEANQKMQEEQRKRDEEEKKLKEQLKPKDYNPTDPNAGEWRKQSKKNLAQLALAMHAYHDKFNKLPQQKGTGLAKNNHLSWRVSILPFLDPKIYPEAGVLYNQFNHNEPWDSPQNKKVLDDNPMPAVLASPLAKEGDKRTHYQIIVGPKTPWSKDKTTLRLQDITDGTSTTFLIVEAKEPVSWTRPEDLRFNGKDVPPLGGIFGGDFHAAMADGAVHFFQRGKYRDDQLTAFITATGGEIHAELPKD